MSTYQVHWHVIYTVDASSPEEASTIVEAGTEFPLMPFTETNYCISDSLIKVTEGDN